MNNMILFDINSDYMLRYCELVNFVRKNTLRKQASNHGALMDYDQMSGYSLLMFVFCFLRRLSLSSRLRISSLRAVRVGMLWLLCGIRPAGQPKRGHGRHAQHYQLQQCQQVSLS